MNLLDALMAGFEPLAGMPLSEGTPANSAKTAKSEATCGPAADFEGCEGLRISANPAAEPAAPSQDSQTFADIRKPENRLQSQQPCGFSQDSQLSQGQQGTNANAAAEAAPRWGYPPMPLMGMTKTAAAADPAAADPADWRAADAAYQDHHFDCTACKAAGRGEHYGSRCPEGAALWRRYEAACTPPDPAPVHRARGQAIHDRARPKPETEAPPPIEQGVQPMSLTVSEGSTATYTPPEAGAFTARCVGLIDLGTQTTTYEGQTKSAKKTLLQFEITDTDNRRDDGAAHVVSKRFTASLHPKAALRGFLESWRGRPFTGEELRAFDLGALLGAACLLGIVHAEKDGKTFANISSVMKLPRGMPAPQGSLDLVRFDLDAPDWKALAALPQRLQEQIAAAPEYARASPPARVSVGSAAAPAAAAPQPAAASSGFDDLDDDVPF